MLINSEFELLGKHIAAGLAFVQNIVLDFESGYFDTSAKFKPLMHLWSLGIEEQFYIVFPLLLYFLWKLRKFVFPVLCLFFIASFICNIWLSSTNTQPISFCLRAVPGSC